MGIPHNCLLIANTFFFCLDELSKQGFMFNDHNRYIYNFIDAAMLHYLRRLKIFISTISSSLLNL